MGNPDWYYKEILFYAQQLCEWDDEMFEIRKTYIPEFFVGCNTKYQNCDKSLYSLESDLLKTRDLFKNKNKFYFICGRAMTQVLMQSCNEGGDSMNACAGACGQLEDLIGVGDGE